MGIQQLLQKFSKTKITIYRVPPGASYRGGIFSIEDAKAMSVFASVQPVQTDFHPDITNTPGNSTRLSLAVKVFTEIEIFMDNPTKQQRADRVEIDGILYEARSRGKYTHFSLGHYETICVKVADK